MKYIIFIIAVLLFILAAPIGIAVSIFRSFYHSHIGRGFSYQGKKFYSIAFCLDQFANAAFPELWDLLFITSMSKNQFGKIAETISYVLGKNQQENTLSKTGILIKNILKKITGKEHCLIAVQQFEQGLSKF